MYHVRLTNHVRARMRQRGVTEDEIKLVVNGPPNRVHYDEEEDSFRLELTLTRGRLKVWVETPWPPRYANATVVIKSAAWKGC